MHAQAFRQFKQGGKVQVGSIIFQAFFNTLQQLGLHDSYYQPHLDEVILECLGLNDGTNDTFDFYCAIIGCGGGGDRGYEGVGRTGSEGGL